MDRARGLRSTLRRHRLLRDSVFVVALFLLALNARPRDAGTSLTHTPATIALLAFGCLLLLLRTVRPMFIWAATVVLGAVSIAIAHGPNAAALPAFIALFIVASRASLRITALAAVVTAIAYVTPGSLSGGWLQDMTYAVTGWAGMVAAIGVAVKNQRGLVAAAEERARRAELTREEEAQRRVSEERMRIARELHDVVAHHISVINVQSGVARHLLDTDPGQARDAISIIRESSRAVLSELSAIVGLLRTREEAAEVQPAPGLRQVEQLVESMRHAGLHTRWHAEGEARQLPPLLDLTAYRIIQESLTNAHKHGAGSAELWVRQSSHAVTIEVVNSVRPGQVPPSVGGHGLIGIRERVHAIGGQLQYGAVDGYFRMHAVLPLEQA